jgi:hypothetical protein
MTNTDKARYELTDEQKKRLTEFLNERYMPGLVGYPYKHEGVTSSNRYFTTPQDAHDLAKKLVEVGRWDDGFENIAERAWLKEPDDKLIDFAAWLLTNPARFCYLVNSYLEEKP